MTRGSDRCKVRIITAEMSYGNGPWHSWSCVTLSPGQLYVAPRYSWTPIILSAMQKNTRGSNETRPDTIDRITRRFRPNMTWHMTLSLSDLTFQVKIFRTCVKLINKRILKVSLRSKAFYASYSRKTMGGSFGLPLQVWGLTLAGTGYFASFLGTGGDTIPPHVWPLVELELSWSRQEETNSTQF